ncbi:hypothetical protein KUM39_21225 [Streptomyces sp. J2-1]|uniref:hypothetical protein n=1 Tax=Streptomyces corallincola TaxID=2851888 RepID=UPI001C37F420|nr:hypothetical protein [Streptomyces corallincola]MBV2356864.1 hypothetical protein [Streptomyces corallincola]
MPGESAMKWIYAALLALALASAVAQARKRRWWRVASTVLPPTGLALGFPGGFGGDRQPFFWLGTGLVALGLCAELMAYRQSRTTNRPPEAPATN